MKFLTIASALFSVALAAPAYSAGNAESTPTSCDSPAATSTPTGNQETVQVTDLTVRENNGIKSVSLTLSGDDAKAIPCSSTGTDIQIPSDVFSCQNNTAYSFGLVAPSAKGSYSVIVYHQTSPFAGRAGSGNVTAIGRAGGDGPADMVYQQFNPVSFVIQSSSS